MTTTSMTHARTTSNRIGAVTAHPTIPSGVPRR